MKKSLRFTAAGLSICMMAAMLAGCSSSSSTDTTAAADASEAAADTQEAEAKTSDLSFAFCTNTLNNTFQSSIDAKLSELCKENGISYTCLDPDYDLNKQLSQLSDCANSGYDAVFVIPVDSAGISWTSQSTRYASLDGPGTTETPRTALLLFSVSRERNRSDLPCLPRRLP